MILIYVNCIPYKRKREREKNIILYINYLVNLFRANDALLMLYKSNKEIIEIAEIKIKRLEKILLIDLLIAKDLP